MLALVEERYLGPILRSRPDTFEQFGTASGLGVVDMSFLMYLNFHAYLLIKIAKAHHVEKAGKHRHNEP